VRRTVPPSAEIEERIDQLLAVGVGENPRESLSELARLGARLIIQRAVEDEFDAWLGRARYERRPEYQRGLRNYDSGLRNGFRPRRVQTAEGELEVETPQVREAAETFASRLFPRGTKLVRTEPLKALVIGAFVRGLSIREVESLCEQAGLGQLSKSTASRICQELRERFEQFKRRDLYDVRWRRCSWTRSSYSTCAAGSSVGELLQGAPRCVAAQRAARHSSRVPAESRPSAEAGLRERFMSTQIEREHLFA
jgi:putative transposase